MNPQRTGCVILMYKMAVVGNKDITLAFKTVGLDVFEVYDAIDVRKTVERIVDLNYGIIFITEKLAALIPDTISRYDQQVLPAIILIPDNHGSLGIGMDKIYKNVEKAVGSDIL